MGSAARREATSSRTHCGKGRISAGGWKREEVSYVGDEEVFLEGGEFAGTVGSELGGVEPAGEDQVPFAASHWGGLT